VGKTKLAHLVRGEEGAIVVGTVVIARHLRSSQLLSVSLPLRLVTSSRVSFYAGELGRLRVITDGRK
jgi:hypothetical protein